MKDKIGNIKNEAMIEYYTMLIGRVYKLLPMKENHEDIDGWKKEFGNTYILITTIILQCNEEELEKRLMERAKTSGRIDDNIDIIKKRFKTHEEQSKPIEEQLKKIGSFIEVQGNGTVEEVFGKIVNQLDKIMEKYNI